MITLLQTALVSAPAPKAGKPAKLLDIPEGLVLYSDGAAAPSNPGPGGWGLHGYIYSDQPPKKGSGNAAQSLTAHGYVEKASAKAGALTEVKALSYVNGFGSYAFNITNNVGELAGVVNGLDYALRCAVKKVTLFTDSRYVMEGATKWLAGWKRNNWLKSDGQPVANQTHWLDLDEKYQALKDSGAQVKIEWLKGHSVHMGNHLADKHATIANLYARRGEQRTEFSTEPVEGYWAPKNERHPFVCQRRIYFCTRPGSSVPGEYHLGEHGKDDELIGKRMADGAYSFVSLRTPEPFIEMMRVKQEQLAQGDEAIIMGRLDKLYEPGTHADLLRFGEICMHQPSVRKLDMHVLPQSRVEHDKAAAQGEPLTKELRPPLLAMRAVEAVNVLHGVLATWRDPAQTSLVTTDITAVFYEQSTKGAALRPEYVVGFNTLTVMVSHPLSEEAVKIELYLGIDLPERNALKRLEKYQPRVYIVTWKESEQSFRHATVIEAEGDYGIWAGVHSNLRLVLPEPSPILT